MKESWKMMGVWSGGADSPPYSIIKFKDHTSNIQGGCLPGPLLMAKRPESDRLHLYCAKMENKLDELSHVSESRLLVATLKVRLAKSKDSAKNAKRIICKQNDLRPKVTSIVTKSPSSGFCVSYSYQFRSGVPHWFIAGGGWKCGDELKKTDIKCG